MDSPQRNLGFRKFGSRIRISDKEMNSHLPMDIIINILLRLPVKSLSRFKCVSTSWRALISDPHFQSTHHDQAPREPLFLFFTLSEEDNDGSRTIHLSSVNQQGRVLNTFTNKIIGFVYSLHTCADLVCFDGSNSIYVCNPSTEEFVTLPQSSNWPNYPHCAVGLGYSSSSKAYKVVRLFRVGCEVFSLDGTDSSWRTVQDCPYGVSGVFPPPFVEGSLHWLITRRSDIKNILSFNVDIEEFSVIPHPEFCSNSNFHRGQLRLVELGGCLCLLDHIQPWEYNIWMLKDYKNHIWVKEYTIDLSPPDNYHGYLYPRAIRWTSSYLNPRAIRSDGAILMETAGETLDYYDPESGTLTKVDGIEVEEGFQFSYYVESFYSLGSR